jgi:hypothetical protein
MTRFILRTVLEFMVLAAFAGTFLFWVAWWEGIIK